MTMRFPLPFLAALAGLTLLTGSTSSCADDLLNDPGFDMWCGDELCAWKIEYGDVHQVPTWHELDEGAQLLGPRTAISQASPIDEQDAECIHFSLVADADEDAVLTLELDFMDDGSIEYSHEIPADDWETVSYHITPPTRYLGLRFRIRMEGEGRAVIAQVRAQEAYHDDCHSPPIELEPGAEPREEGGELPPEDTGF
jgi:hypothetical protein